MTTIKLYPPKELPEDGISAVAFEAWQNQVISFLEQEIINHEFISGIYRSWVAKTLSANGRRISEPAASDPEQMKIDAKHSAATDGGAAARADAAELLLKRNAQLTKCLQLVANLCQLSEQADIMNNSTSFAYIWDYLLKFYNIESKGSHFLSVASLTLSPGQKPEVFFKQVRNGFMNNLKKKGDRILYNNTILKQDETLSPTFENAIMLYVLEKIDKKLPAKVQKDFGFRMEGDTTLYDLQTAVFQAVPGMLAELDNGVDLKAVNAITDGEVDQPAHLAAAGFFRGGRGRGSSRFRGGRGGSRGFLNPFPTRGSSTSRGGSTVKKEADRYCRVCKLAGKNDSVVRSHNIGDCFFFTSQDQADLVARLNTAQLEYEVDTGDNSPYYDLQGEDEA